MVNRQILNINLRKIVYQFSLSLFIYLFIYKKGKRKKSDKILLENSIFESFSFGKIRNFTIETEEIDDLLSIDIELCNNIASRNWFLNRVIITDERGEQQKFPCYKWVIPGENPITLRNERGKKETL